MRGLSIAAAAALLALLAGAASADSFTFTHLAGATGGGGAQDGTGDQARLLYPAAITLGPDGTLFVSETLPSTLRRITTSREVTTFAGMAGDAQVLPGRPGQNRLLRPGGSALDADGNLFVAAERVILRITPGGVVSVWTGSADVATFLDGTLLEARFQLTRDLAFDGDGNLFVLDGDTIRKITPSGIVSTLAGSPGLAGSVDGTGSAARFNYPTALCVDENDDLYVADSNNHTIRRVTQAGVVTTVAGLAGSPGYVDGAGSVARFAQPRGIAAMSGGIFYVADYDNNRIRKILKAGASYTVSTLAGGSSCNWIDSPITPAAFCHPAGLAVNQSDGSVYVADHGNHAIRKVSSGGLVTTVAGKGPVSGYLNGNGTSARFNVPSDIAVTSNGAAFVTDTDNNVIRAIGTDRAVSLFAGDPETAGAVDGTGAAARFRQPRGIAASSTSILYVADTANQTIRRIGTDRVVTTLAGSASQAGSSDGTGAAARFRYPRGITTSGTTVFVADTDNHTIRKIITSTAVVTTLAGFAGESGSADGTALARFNRPSAIAADSAGNLYVADTWNHTIRKVTPAGAVTTIAGLAGSSGADDGTGSAARFNNPFGIAVEERSEGLYLYVSDGSMMIRMIAPGNVVTTLGGTPQIRGMTDGTDKMALFNNPAGLDVHDGSLFIADLSNHCIRRGTPAIATVATIDSPNGALGVVRQLAASPAATSHAWSIVRRPSASSALLSSNSSATPVFTPDVADVYRFRLTAVSSAGLSITDVQLTGDCPALTVAPTSVPSGRIHVAYSQTFTVGGGVPPYTIGLQAGGLPQGLTLSSTGTLAGVPAEAGDFTFTVRATDYYGCTGDREYTLVIQNIAAPTGLVATASGENAVTLSWSASADAAGYRIYRGSQVVALSLLTQVEGLTHTDLTVAPNTSYLYKVRAYDSHGSESADSTGDVATTIAFTDPLLGPGTQVKAVHFTQLRTAVNALRGLAGYAPYTWIAPAPASGGLIHVIQLSELRVAITNACIVLGLSTSFTDPALNVGSVINAAHVTELRDRVK